MLIHDDAGTTSTASQQRDDFVIPSGWKRLHHSRKRKLHEEDSDEEDRDDGVSVGGKAPRISHRSVAELSSDARLVHEAMQKLQSKFQAFRNARPGGNSILFKNIERTMQCLSTDIKASVQ